MNTHLTEANAKSFCGQLIMSDAFDIPLLVHISKFPMKPGYEMRSADYTLRPHFSFFVEPIPAEWAKNQDYRARRDVEEAFEAVRESKFPLLPSRKTSIFAALGLSSVAQFRNPGAGRKDAVLYEIEVSAGYKIGVANFLWYNLAVRIQKGDPEFCRLGYDLSSAAQNYWEGRDVPGIVDQKYEVLVDGIVKIKQII